MSDMRPLASAIRFVIWFPMLMMFLLMAVMVAASRDDRDPAPREGVSCDLADFASEAMRTRDQHLEWCKVEGFR